MTDETDQPTSTSGPAQEPRLLTYSQLQEANEYVATVKAHYDKTQGDLPLPLRRSLMAYFRHPSISERDKLATGLIDSILDVTRQTYDPEAEEFPGFHERAAFFMLTHTYAVSKIKDDVIGMNQPPNKPEQGVVTKAVTDLSWVLPPIDDSEYQRLATHSAAMLAADPNTNLWFQTKIHQFLNASKYKKNALEYLSDNEAGENIDELKAENDRLAESIRFLQKYMPKDCVAPALPGTSTQEWLVSPPFEQWLGRPYHPSYRLKFLMFGSSQPIETGEIERHSFGNERVDITHQTLSGLTDADLTVGVAVGEDGELYSSYGQRLLDYLPDSMRSNYEELRSEALCIYYDSTVPVYYTELAERQLAVSEARADDDDLPPAEQRQAKLRRLVLARRRIADHHREAIVEMLDDPEAEKVKRHMIRHDVVGFIRPLPPHYRASPEARALCLHYTGIVLEEFGETFVKPHKRGDIDGQHIGHKAVFSEGKMAARLSENQPTEE